MESVFGPQGKLAGAHPAYEYRAGQQAMATAVGRTLEQGGGLMVEAGTGTGKTLAYLVPALESGRQVIISTGTRNLQDQIYGRDLPFLRDRLGLRFSAVMMKGRANYVCRYRLAEFEREPLLEDLGERSWVGRITDWAAQTSTGDRAEIADLPDHLKLWKDINATADTCTGRRCPEYEQCWLTRLKREAQNAQVVVVNHHLFFADLAVRSAYGAVLPDYDTVVFDEAHLIEEIATQYFGVQVSALQLEDLARGAERLAAETGGPSRGGGGAAGLRDAATEFFLPLRRRIGAEAGRGVFESTQRGGPDLEAEWAVLCEALDEVARQAERNEPDREGADGIAQRSAGLREALGVVLSRDDPAFVYGIEQRGRGNVTVSAAPIDVSVPLRERLFDRLDAFVLTSATLTVGNRFDFFAKRLGLNETETLQVDSSFDYGDQALLYLPRGMPEPRQPEFTVRAVETIVQLLEISRGRAFVLFTSYAQMQRVHDALEPLGRWPLILQGQGSKAALVDRFKDTPGAVLLGTTSFWHGVDVRGDSLSLVIVDKLPFDVPSDPLVAARIERIRATDGNPFMEYQVPLAVLELKQGLGRLLRGRSDRGMLAVLDPRLTTKRYGKTFLKSLPPYRIVRDLAPCAEFFATRDPGSRREAAKLSHGLERIEIVEGDLTRFDSAAIVNAANTSLLGGGGVDGAIHRAAGPRLLEECRALGGCATGQAKLTGGYDLPARHVIHTVGPVWRGGRSGEPELLASCYRECLRLAVEHGLDTLAFPAVSCGVYGYPVDAAARIAIETVASFLDRHPSIVHVHLVCFGREAFDAYDRTYRSCIDETTKSGPPTP